MFHGLTSNLSSIFRLSEAETRSISPENPDGRHGGGGRHIDPDHDQSRGLGQGWKVRPCVEIGPGQTLDLAEITGPGVIQSVWMTMRGKPRLAILRAYWDRQTHSSIQCPRGDFFASAYGTPERFVPVVSQAVCVNPGSAYNSYWPMPFREHARLTLTNLDDAPLTLYFQINYALAGLPDDTAYFHAQFRRVNPLPKGEVVTLLDDVSGRGHYAGTYLAWALNHDRWWGEGEVKFYLDEDMDPALSDGKAIAGSTGFPTICGTGTEDYFGGSYNFEDKAEKRYRVHCTPYCGLPDVVRPDGLYRSQMRFGMYRWHLPDPIRFRETIKVTVQALGWKPGGRRYLQRQDDIASVAYLYQTLPSAPLRPLPSKDDLELT